MMPLAFLGSFGPWEMAILAGVCLLFFGNRLPSVMRSLGKSVTEFKKGINDVQEDIDKAVTTDKKSNPPEA